ncbi:MAG TPA: M1 family aminopeptidase, partial [Longimicrobiales bacterium]
INHELRFLLAHYPAAYAVERTAGTHPIRQRLENLNEAGQLYGAIIYEKAPIVMRMLEELVGAETFRRGVDEYLRSHAYGNASWPDLIDVLDRLAPSRHLKPWSHVWVEEAGRPTVAVQVATSNGRVTGITLAQSDPQGRGRVWTEPVTPALVYGDSVTRRLPVLMAAAAVAVPGARGAAAPDVVLPNGAGRAYGLMVLDPYGRAALLNVLPVLRDPLARAGAWLDAWDALQERQITPTDFMAPALRAIDVEADEQLAERILGYTADAYWHFLSAEQRRALAPGLESLLWRKLAAAQGTSRKAAYFAALRSVALTPETVARLRRVWARDTTIAGLPLSEQDYTTLALELALRAPSDADSILGAQEARIQNPDRKARLAFVRPALSPDAALRDAWFAALREPANRRHEPWVLEGLSYLDHPLRQRESQHYIRPALDLLEEVRRTGDIFFPGRWVAAVLSGHTSPAAAAIVRDFLAQHPGYPVRLRQLVLQGADELFRSATRAPAGEAQ